MKHARQKIREWTETALAAIPGVTIYRSRVYPIVSPPVISIYANDEQSDTENEAIPSPIRYTRRLALTIDVAVEAIQDHDDLMDDYAAQVEAIMSADPTLGENAVDAKLIRTTISQSGEADTPVAVASLTFEVWYRTSGTDPETPL